MPFLARNLLRDQVIPSVLRQLNVSESTHDILKEMIFFKYFSPEIIDPRTKDQIFDQIIEFFTDIYFAAPLEKQLNDYADALGTSFFYTNSFVARTPEDIFGNQ